VCGQSDRISMFLGKAVAERMNPSSWDATSTRVYPRFDLSLFELFLFYLIYGLLKVDNSLFSPFANQRHGKYLR
jgi:hypothetical protein